MVSILEGMGTSTTSGQEALEPLTLEEIKEVGDLLDRLKKEIGEPIIQHIMITNKLGLEQIENELNQPNRVLLKELSLTSMNGIDVIVQDTDSFGLCKPHAKIYRLESTNPLDKARDLDWCKRDFYIESIVKAKSG